MQDQGVVGLSIFPPIPFKSDLLKSFDLILDLIFLMMYYTVICTVNTVLKELGGGMGVS